MSTATLLCCKRSATTCRRSRTTRASNTTFFYFLCFPSPFPSFPVDLLFAWGELFRNPVIRPNPVGVFRNFLWFRMLCVQQVVLSISFPVCALRAHYITLTACLVYTLQFACLAPKSHPEP